MKNTTTGKIKASFWRTYYKLTIGKEEFDKRLKRAIILQETLKDCTRGSIEHFYDIDGNQIRGWHKHIRFQKDQINPLIKKYS